MTLSTLRHRRRPAATAIFRWAILPIDYALVSTEPVPLASEFTLFPT
jgi:hypothetical protein